MYYVDRYLGEVVKEKDNFAAPERYYEYRKGTDGIVKETYIVDYDPLKLIDFVYPVDEDLDFVYIKRNILLKEYGVYEHPVLYAYAVPPEWYDQAVENINGR